MITAHDNGHKIYFDNEKWRYIDNNESTDMRRPCVTCNMPKTKEGHDYCIRNLPGVKNACCGHGIHEGYIVFEDDRIVRGNFSIEGLKR